LRTIHTRQVAEDRAASDTMVREAVAEKAKEFAAKVAEAFEEGRAQTTAAVEQAVSLVREQGRIVSASAAAAQSRALAGAKLFVQTAAQQLAALQRDLDTQGNVSSAPTAAVNTTSEEAHAEAEAMPQEL
jgi:precorrin-4 methylase